MEIRANRERESRFKEFDEFDGFTLVLMTITGATFWSAVAVNVRDPRKCDRLSGRHGEPRYRLGLSRIRRLKKLCFRSKLDAARRNVPS